MADVRPARPEDLDAIGLIAFATGFFGESAAAFFPDRELFTALWVAPYLRGGGSCNFVAEVRGEIRGYVVGAASAASYRRRLLLEGAWVAAGIAAGRYQQPRRCLRYLWRLTRFRTGSAPASAYPSHLHINVLPGARGRGLGAALLRAHLACLEAAGVRGIQISTTRENRGALRLYRRLGFTIYSERTSALWEPWLGRPSNHLVLIRDLSADGGSAPAGDAGR